MSTLFTYLVNTIFFEIIFLYLISITLLPRRKQGLKSKVLDNTYKFKGPNQPIQKTLKLLCYHCLDMSKRGSQLFEILVSCHHIYFAFSVISSTLSKIQGNAYLSTFGSSTCCHWNPIKYSAAELARSNIQLIFPRSEHWYAKLMILGVKVCSKATLNILLRQTVKRAVCKPAII